MNFLGSLIIGIAGFVLGFAAVFGLFSILIDGLDLTTARHGQIQYMAYALGGIAAVVAMARARMIR